MTTTAPLRQHHQHCDELFASAEEAVTKGDWANGGQSLESFLQEMENHFQCEEQTLFPAFEAATGMSQGPTQVMRIEHGQMRELMQQMQEALAQQDADSFGGAAETLLIFMQQHNMKEENILYPMCDQRVGTDVAEKVQVALHSHA